MKRKTVTSVLSAVAALTLLAGAGCNNETKAEQCARLKGTVEVDHSTKVEVKNGKRTIKTVKEYECKAPDGTEMFEWK